MLYAEELTEAEDCLFGMWAYDYFSIKGTSNAYSYKSNEELLLQFQSDMTVCTKLPVMLLGTEDAADQETEPSEAEVFSEEVPEESEILTGELFGFAPLTAVCGHRPISRRSLMLINAATATTSSPHLSLAKTAYSHWLWAALQLSVRLE